MKSGQEGASEGIARQTEAFDATHAAPEFPGMPSDAAIRSAGQREPGELAEAFLRAVATGDDGAVPLAIAVADSVLAASGVKLAQSVLEGGPLTLTRAIRLAELILGGRTVDGKAGVL